MKKRTKYCCLALLAPVLLLGMVDYFHRLEAKTSSEDADTLLLLVPDSVEFSAVPVQEWVDAANEEGLHLQPIHDSEFLNLLSPVHAAGVILPDQLHRSANDVLIGELYQYVRSGGNLLVVYDACTFDLNNHFTPGESRLSALVGVRYGLYDLYHTSTMEETQVTGPLRVMKDLGIPPGSFEPVDSHGKLARWRSVADRDDTSDRFAFTAYQYGALDYPVFHTLGDFDGETLLQSKLGLVAGRRQEGLGQVLFVNLPVGYLASRTDGLLLHSFLRFFAVHMIGLPYLSTVPDGMGGLVFNWHIDAHFALRPLEILVQDGVFDRNRFSVHFTAGPDVDAFGDHKGLDVLHDPQAQKLIRYLVAHGQEIGSHGGWIHNYFGSHVNDDNESSFEKYLVLNKQALERVSGKQIIEYSAPVGTHPAWVTRWLEHHGFVAYYFTGDAGMGPTHVYRDGKRDAPGIWAFPILHMGKEASMEEMEFDDVPINAVREWLFAVTDYVSREHNARLVYTHPFGAERFFPTLRAWLENADGLESEGRFHWYTMTELSRFLTQRESVHWTLLHGAEGNVTLRATHPKTLAHATWVFSQDYYHDPRVVEGHATTRAQDKMVFITANDCRQLTVELSERGKPAHSRNALEAKE